MLIINTENLWIYCMAVLLLVFILSYKFFLRKSLARVVLHVYQIAHTLHKRLLFDYTLRNHRIKWLNANLKIAVLAHFKALNIYFKT